MGKRIPRLFKFSILFITVSLFGTGCDYYDALWYFVGADEVIEREQKNTQNENINSNSFEIIDPEIPLINLSFSNQEDIQVPVNSILDDLNPNLTETLWVVDSKIDPATNLWMIKVVKQGITGEVVAVGTTVSAKIVQSLSSEEVVAVVREDGWASFGPIAPGLNTQLFVTAIDGDVPWDEVDKLAKELAPVLSVTWTGSN